MKENYKTLVQALIISLILTVLIGIFYYSSTASMPDDMLEITHNILNIGLIGGFFAAWLISYLLIDDIKKRKKKK